MHLFSPLLAQAFQDSPRLLELRKLIVDIGGDAAHDYAHAIRVAENGLMLSMQLGSSRGTPDIEEVIAACLLHDAVFISKASSDRLEASRLSAEQARRTMISLDYSSAAADRVALAVLEHSYGRSAAPTMALSAIVQDADRLDALGAIGILRATSTGEALCSRYYDVADPWAKRRDYDERSFVLDHFFTKLFKLPALMNTAPARAEGHRRVRFMLQFLQQLGMEIGAEFDSAERESASSRLGEREAVVSPSL